ncbi:pyridoxal phosphate-dependent aminotransferase [Nonomuraea sp. NPDC049655]|uniref:pyridoxal phosphate-dependent aminotransferase n=1 Tax=Nonomuraea sp. NPDC049655 TaxID=3364355 RepID=UPI0037BBC114
MHALHDVLDSGRLANPLGDARLIEHYRGSGGDPAGLIYLSLGETWTQAAPGLVAALSRGLPDLSHGYTLSPYGLPDLRRALTEYIVTTHRLPRPSGPADYEVAVSQDGTRAAMFDFGRLLVRDGAAPPTVLVPAPGWDYPGVFAPLGCRVRYYAVDAAQGHQPVPDQVAAELERAAATGRPLLVLNAQHNPTAANWDARTVRAMIATALDHRAAVLVDDAYYAVHDPDVRPTNTLKILLAEMGRHPRGATPWLAVRTLGKQFHCNGWGVGALTAHPGTLAALAAQQHHHSYGSGLPLQAAMARWLRDPACEIYLQAMRAHYADARRHAAARLTAELGFPRHACHAGECTSYLRLRVPPRYVDETGGEEGYRRLCLDRAGVLPGTGSMVTPGPPGDGHAHVRLFLGHPRPILDEAIDRLARHGLGWT